MKRTKPRMARAAMRSYEVDLSLRGFNGYIRAYRADAIKRWHRAVSNFGRRK